MTSQEFHSMKAALTADLARSMYATLVAMGDKVRYIDLVSMQPAMEAYRAQNERLAA